jgi:hypothetical protein
MDPGVYDGHPARAGDHGVEVKLGDLGKVIGQAGDAQQEILERRQVGGRAAPMAEQQRR